MRALLLAVPLVTAQPYTPDVLLSTFNGTGKATQAWTVVTDRGSGGTSAGHFSVSDGFGQFEGEITPLAGTSSPGFVVVHSNITAAVWGCRGLTVAGAASGDYAGFKISFGIGQYAAAGLAGPYPSFGYKASFAMPAGNASAEVYIPLDDFSSGWTAPPGHPTAACSQDTSVCPTFLQEQNIEELQLWAEGVSGRFHFRIDSIRASKCYRPSARAAAGGAAAPRSASEWIEFARTAPEDILAAVSWGEGRVHAPLLPESAAAVDEVDGSSTPVVTAHGMGDSCFNPVSMARVTREIGAHLRTYAKCIPTGSGLASDSASGYFSGVEEAVDLFAEGIRNDSRLAGGFDAVGFSQGNTLIRGYIHRYNSPPVRRWLSVHGTVSGVVNVPGCDVSSTSSLCQTLSHALLAPAAYTSTIQHHIFQAGYLRDPKRLDSSAYKKNSVIAQWNNEGDTVNATYKDNFVKVEKFIMVKALQDTIVEPKEGEHWEFVDSTGAVVPMKDSVLYTEDRFGLQSVDKAGKLVFETTKGDHLKFSQAELFGWLDKYFAGTAKTLVV